jgi:hypothetical protein
MNKGKGEVSGKGDKEKEEKKLILRKTTSEKKRREVCRLTEKPSHFVKNEA